MLANYDPPALQTNVTQSKNITNVLYHKQTTNKQLKLLSLLLCCDLRAASITLLPPLGSKQYLNPNSPKLNVL